MKLIVAFLVKANQVCVNNTSYKYKRQVGALTMVVAQVLREEVSVCYTRVGALVL